MPKAVTGAVSDPIADFLTRIRNGIAADHEEVVIPSSRLKKELARILLQEGYIEKYEIDTAPGSRGRGRFEVIRIRLKYTPDRRSVISGLKRVSKPGRRQYARHDDLPRVLGGMGTAVVSTSRGVMTANDARRQGVGGEVLAHIW